MSATMKTIGLLGGMSWESTANYYRTINEAVKARRGALHSARIALYSVDFQPLEEMQHAGDWEGIARQLSEDALRVQATGADLLLICTNTMHKVADAVADAIDIPLLHIADATANAIKAKGLERVGLLGTRFTMEEAFYRERLVDQHGLDVLIPHEADRAIVHDVIYDELCLGQCHEHSRDAYLRIVDDLIERGAQGIILGCTEIVMLLGTEHPSVPLFDTAELHALAAVDATS